MYVPYPTLGQALRLPGLTPIDWGACCRFPGGDFPSRRVADMQLEMLGPDPVLRLLPDSPAAPPIAIDLRDGHEFTDITLPGRRKPRPPAWAAPGGYTGNARLPGQRDARPVDRRQLPQGRSAIRIHLAGSEAARRLHIQPYRHRGAVDHGEAALLELAGRDSALALLHLPAGAAAAVGGRRHCGRECRIAPDGDRLVPGFAAVSAQPAAAVALSRISVLAPRAGTHFRRVHPGMGVERTRVDESWGVSRRGRPASRTTPAARPVDDGRRTSECPAEFAGAPGGISSRVGALGEPRRSSVKLLVLGDPAAKELRIDAAGADSPDDGAQELAFISATRSAAGARRARRHCSPRAMLIILRSTTSCPRCPCIA